MKSIIVQETPIIEKIVVEFTPEEARALYAICNWSDRVAIAVAVLPTNPEEPLRHASEKIMEEVLGTLFHLLQEGVQRAYPGVNG